MIAFPSNFHLLIIRVIFQGLFISTVQINMQEEMVCCDVEFLIRAIGNDKEF